MIVAARRLLYSGHDACRTCGSFHRCNAACARSRGHRGRNAAAPPEFDHPPDVRPLVCALRCAAAGVAASRARRNRRAAASVGAVRCPRHLHDQRANHDFRGQSDRGRLATFNPMARRRGVGVRRGGDCHRSDFRHRWRRESDQHVGRAGEHLEWPRGYRAFVRRSWRPHAAHRPDCDVRRFRPRPCS